MNNEKRTKVFNDHAQKVVAAVCGAIAEAMKKGEGLESVIFFGKFSEMRATPKVIYKVECRGDEDVVIGGEMTFAPKRPRTRLTISENEISLRRANGFNGAVFCLEKDIVDALVAFFARCHARRM